MRLEVGEQDASIRVRAWEDMIRQNFFGLDCDSDPHTLRGLVEGRAVDAGVICRCSVSRQSFSRTRSLIDRDASATAVVLVMTRGTIMIDQDERASLINSGDLCVIDATRPFDLRLATDTVECGVLHVPKSRLTGRIGQDRTAFQAFGPDRPLQRLTATFSRGLIDTFDQLDHVTLGTLIEQALDLVALMVAESPPGRLAPSTHRTGTLMRIKAYIRARLKEETLSIEQASRALNISARYINALLALEGTSFGRYVRARRLEGARREILDPARAHAQITEIGLGWGFANPSHFGRVFKERYGLSPREARAGGRRA